MFRGFDTFTGFYHGYIDYYTFESDGYLDYTENYAPSFPNSRSPYSTDIWADEAIEILQTKASVNDATPFTMTIAFNAPHSPVHGVQPYRAQCVTNGEFTGDHQMRINYTSMIRAMDYRIDDIINTLKTEKINGEAIWDNTWVWFFSDNGPAYSPMITGNAYPLRGAKSTLFEGGVRTPAFVTGGLLPDELKGTSTDYVVHITDLAKTICTQSGSNCDDLDFDGVDLTNLTENKGIDVALENRHIVLNVDRVGCIAEFNGKTVCGGIIKDFGEDGIFKAVIGNQINGTDEKFGWIHLGSQQFQNDPTVDCGGTEPVFDVDFLANDCANNHRVCLYNLTADPCEYGDLSENGIYQNILNELMDTLVYEYEIQPDSFFSICDISDQPRITATSNRGWYPWAKDYYNNDSYSLVNTVKYQDVCPVKTTHSYTALQQMERYEDLTVLQQIESYSKSD